ncbi:MAG: head fiber protein [Fusobacteriaceae bacterium]
MNQTEYLKLNKPGYENLADIEILNENFEKIDKNAKESLEKINSKEPAISKKTGFNLDKTDVTEDNTNKLFTAKGALNLLNTLTNAINTVATNLSNHITKKVSTTEDGHMTKSDKVKLDGIAQEANKYILPLASPSILGGVKVGSNLNIVNGILSANVGFETCFIPIGFVIMTDDNKLNPATLFPRTTWGRIAENRNIRGATASDGLGVIGGNDTVSIVQGNLPNINLTAPDHTHTRGSMEITGGSSSSIFAVAVQSDLKGAFYGSYWADVNRGTTTGPGYFPQFQASRSWTGATSGSSNRNIPLGGSGVGLNVTNAFYKMHIWKRLT